MIITVKTLQQKTFKVEIDEAETVLAFKQKIEELQGPTFPVAAMKLIYSGKIMDDTQPLSTYNIQETNFVVVMISKVKAPAKPEAKPTTSSTASTSGTPAVGGATPTPAATTTTPAAATVTQSSVPTTSTTTTTDITLGTTTTTDTSTDSSTAPTATTSTDIPGWQQAPSVLVIGTDYEKAVDNLMAMGFPREQVVLALQASYNNPDRAVEYLMGDLPMPTFDEPQEGQLSGQAPSQAPPISQPPSLPPQQTSTNSSQPSTGGSSAGGPSAGGPSTSGPLASGPSLASGPTGDMLSLLSQLPQFNRLRMEVQRNPNLLQPLLQEIGATNPELLGVINQNQQRFLDLLNAPPTAASSDTSSTMDEGILGSPPGTISISVTPEDKAAIERLKAMGFSEAMVIQAYFACDKNEELAANFLFGDRDDD